MKYVVTGIAAAAALAMVALTPGTAEAGSRHYGWGGGWGPGFGIYVGPRSYYRGYGYRPYYNRPYYNRYSYGYGPRWKYRTAITTNRTKRSLLPALGREERRRSGIIPNTGPFIPVAGLAQ